MLRECLNQSCQRRGIAQARIRGDCQHARLMREQFRDRVCEHRVAEYHELGELRGQQVESAPFSYTKNASDATTIATSVVDREATLMSDDDFCNGTRLIPFLLQVRLVMSF